MAQLTSSPHSSLLFLTILGMAMASSGFRLPCLHPMERITSPSIGQKVSNLAEWAVLYPFFTLHDRRIQTMSEPKFSSSNPKSQGRRNDSWLPASQPLMEVFTEEDEPSKSKRPDFSPWTGKRERRNIVVADDAAFRQKSKLLTAMERQNWLNSYMQKLLVVNSQWNSH